MLSLVGPVLLLLFPSAEAAETFEGKTYYLGDLHAHTAVSGDAASAEDGTCWGTCGSQDEIVQTAKDNGLDFVAFTDHTNGDPTIAFPYSSAEAYADLLATVLAADEPGTFVTIPAAEVWFRYAGSGGGRLGHKTLLMFGDTDVLAGFTQADTWATGVVAYASISDCDQIDSWMDQLNNDFGPALLLPHHSSATVPMATDFSCFADEYEVAVEVYSVHGNFLAESPTWDAPTKGITAGSSIEAAMDPDGLGLQFGFFAGTDRHDTLPGEVCRYDQYRSQHQYGGGLTVVVADADADFERKTVFYALLERRTYATSGPMIPVNLAWSAAGESLGGLGDSLTMTEGTPLDVEVRVPTDDAASILSVEVVGPRGYRAALSDLGQGVWEGSFDLADAPEYLYVEVRVDGQSYWGLGSCVDGGADDDEYLWLSPSWITWIPPVTPSARSGPWPVPTRPGEAGLRR